MDYINGAGYTSNGVSIFVGQIDSQNDRKEYYAPLNSVEYVYKIGHIILWKMKELMK
jgi:hypothetical protein